jgi:hypothetical protein
MRLRRISGNELALTQTKLAIYELTRTANSQTAT